MSSSNHVKANNVNKNQNFLQANKTICYLINKIQLILSIHPFLYCFGWWKYSERNNNFLTYQHLFVLIYSYWINN